jgi:hypothetical protein
LCVYDSTDRDNSRVRTACEVLWYQFHKQHIGGLEGAVEGGKQGHDFGFEVVGDLRTVRPPKHAVMSRDAQPGRADGVWPQTFDVCRTHLRLAGRRVGQG